MGHDRECRESLYDIAEDFGVKETEPYLIYWRIIVLAKTLAHYSTAPECEELAAKMRMIEIHPDPDDEAQMAISRSLPLPVDKVEEP